MSKRILVVGGGAAGMMAAITAARQGAAVSLVERNERLGRKLYITGKGRCNVTNDCSPEQVLSQIPRGNRFLYSAMNRFPPEETMAFFRALGVELKTERGIGCSHSLTGLRISLTPWPGIAAATGSGSAWAGQPDSV